MILIPNFSLSLFFCPIQWPYLVEWVTPSKLAGKIGGYFDAVATSLNVSYTLRMPADWQWGTCELDGSACTGMLGDTFYNVSHKQANNKIT